MKKIQIFLMAALVGALIPLPAWADGPDDGEPTPLESAHAPTRRGREEELAGKVALAPLRENQVIYLHQVMDLERWRLSGDPYLEVVSFPIGPARAAGGEIKRGSRINIYRIAIEPPRVKAEEGASPAEEKMRMKGAAVEQLCEDVPVVDVRSSKGGKAGVVVSRETGPMGKKRRVRKRVKMAIITVAVPHQVAQEIIRLQGELKAGYDIWVTLAPMKR